MATTQLVEPRAGRSGALRWFDGCLRVLAFVLALLTGIGIPFAAVVIAGHGSIELEAEVEDPYTVIFGLPDNGAELPHTPYVGVARDRIVVHGNFPVAGEEKEHVRDAPRVRTRMTVAPEDRDTRVAVVVMVVLLLGLAWVAVGNLRRVVRSAREGNPFEDRNVVRLRCLAGVAVGTRIVTALAANMLDRLADFDVDVRIRDVGPSWWLAVGVALGLLALAEVFGAGHRLQELEDATI